MGKDIFVLSGSPRAGGNTETLVKAFMKGAAEAGHRVSIGQVGQNQVRGCIACDTCWSKGTPCSFSDGFNLMAPKLEQAEILVLATPIYFFDLTAQIKAAIDKMYSYMRAPQPLKINAAALIACAGDTDPAVFSGAVETYTAITTYLEWRDLGRLLVPGVEKIGDVAKTPFSAKAEEFGRTIA